MKIIHTHKEVLIILVLTASIVSAADSPQWGHYPTRNMVSPETDLPSSFNLETGKNIKWKTKLGTQCWATPIVAKGKVFIGTNNENPRDPKNIGDRCVLFCLDEKTGELIWQLVSAKLEGDRFKDWPKVGMSSPVTVEGNHVYLLNNRQEVICMDINGMANGNDGPFKDEGKHMVQSQDEPLKPDKLDADILWINNLQETCGVYPHDSIHGSILIDGDYLYLNTANGVDNTHLKVPCPDAPSLVVINKKTGKLVAHDKELMGRQIFHATWASPSIGTLNNQKLLFFGGGDGVCYAFKPIRKESKKVQALEKVWQFDCDPEGPKEDLFEFSKNRQEGPSIIKGMPVYHDGKVYVAAGGDIWWGKRKSWLKCIDAAGSGNVTGTGEVWSFEMKGHCCATPSIHDGLIYITSCDKNVYCLDAKTGKLYWSHEAKGQIWGSTMVADGKIYFGTRSGYFYILATGKQKKVLCEAKLDSSTSGTPTIANSTVYVTTMNNIYAIEKE